MSLRVNLDHHACKFLVDYNNCSEEKLNSILWKNHSVCEYKLHSVVENTQITTKIN